MTREEKVRKAISALIDCAEAAKGTEFSDYYIMGADALRQQEHFREVTKKVETVTKVNDLYDEDGGDIPLNAKTMTLDDAIAHLDDTLSDTGRKWSCKSCRMEHVQLRAWLAELRDIKQERNAPLTLDELRKMDGKLVWVKLFDPDEEFWVLRNEWVDTRNPEPMILFHMRWYSHADYGKTWLAYRQKPEEGTV